MPRTNPVVIAYHLIWTAYGTWLPNDLRGSGSRGVGSPRAGGAGTGTLGAEEGAAGAECRAGFLR